MSTLPIMKPSRPVGTNKISQGTFAYFKARLKQRMFNVVIGEFRKSGLTKADYGKRLGMDAAQVNRLLGGPGNLTLETVSALLFAATGAELSGLALAYPLYPQESREVEPSQREAITPLSNGTMDSLTNDTAPLSASQAASNHIGLSQSLQEMRLGGLAGLPKIGGSRTLYGPAPLNSPGINRTGLESGYVPIQAVENDLFSGGTRGATFANAQRDTSWASSTAQMAEMGLVG
ncbi:MAG: hypothetical protein JO216_03935 [Hyphomicrobiales bacterium]|nr:hypothetical protein [Hyphomicrobiales bacterium]